MCLKLKNKILQVIEIISNYGLIFAIYKFILFMLNYICLFDYLFISSQMSAKPYFIGSTGILLLW